MSLVKQYFQHFHHINEPAFEARALHFSEDKEALSILLCANEANLPLFMQTPSFISLLPELNNPLFSNNIFDYILSLQYTLIEGNANIFEELMPYFAKLNLAEVIDEATLKLFGTLKPTFTPKIAPKRHTKLNIKDMHNALLDLHNDLAPLLDSSLSAQLKDIQAKLESKHFSIGITGVLSAGKSTFLNALIGKDMLGSSAVPETANLSILKYGKSEGARVHFWSKDEWEQLRADSVLDSSLKDFLAKSEAHFKNTLTSYITTPPKSQDIALSELSSYTSANHTSKMCNLIKEVELFVPLAFLQNGVEIVDTPGLDDPIRKREDITLSYIERCDMLIHVMNASCAATQKDIDFILEALLSFNIQRLLIVLTRIDLITKAELESSLNYTRQSLIAQLQKANYKGDVYGIIERIDFLPLAGYAALLHRIGADTSGINVSLEDSGILAIDGYLNDMLLGEDSKKAQDKLFLAYNATLKLSYAANELLELESRLINASEDELESIIAKEKAQNEALLAESKQLEAHLLSLHSELADFLHALELLSANTLEKTATQTKQKVLNDIIYAYANNTKPSAKDLEMMIELGLKDSFADIARMYKYRLSTKITQLKMDISDKSELDSSPLPPIHFALNSQEISALLGNTASSLSHIIDKKLKDNALEVAISESFNDMLGAFSALVLSKNEAIKQICLDYFKDIVAQVAQAIEARIATKRQSLESALKQKQSGKSESLKAQMHDKTIKLQGIIAHTLEQMQQLTER